MLNRWSLLMLVVGALVGYTVAGSSVDAQGEPLPFSIGDTVTLSYEKDGGSPSLGNSVECAVAEIRGIFVKCGPRGRISGGTDRVERWLTLKYVVLITRRES